MYPFINTAPAAEGVADLSRLKLTVSLSAAGRRRPSSKAYFSVESRFFIITFANLKHYLPMLQALQSVQVGVLILTSGVVRTELEVFRSE